MRAFPMIMEATTNKTRLVIKSLFSTIADQGFGQLFLDQLAENVIWTATGSSPMRGRYESKQAYREQVLDKLHDKLEYSPRPTIDRIIADDQWAAVYFHTEGARALNGLDFSMEYCWLMRVENDKVVEVVGFYDSKKMCDLFL